MAAIFDRFRESLAGEDGEVHFNWRYFAQDFLGIGAAAYTWLVVLGIIALVFVSGQIQTAPVTSLIVLAVWLTTLVMMIRSEIVKKHSPMTLWLKDNLYSSLSNALITLLLVLGIIAAIRGFYTYAWVNASFSLDRAVNDEVTDFGRSGARWGAVRANLANLLVFRVKDELYRVWATLLMIAVLAVPSFIIFRDEKYKNSFLRTLFTWAWIFSPFTALYFLRGFGPEGESFRWLGVILAVVLVAVGYGMGIVQNRFGDGQEDSRLWAILNPVLGVGRVLVVPIAIAWVLANLSGSGRFYALDVDTQWGGLLLSLVFSFFAIVVSFPLGVALALGRRSQIQGVPWWITYPAAAIIFFITIQDSPAAAAAARTTLGRIIAWWPVLIPIVAYGFQRSMKGNVVALLSTVYIEAIRGVPLITLLFASVILFGIFLPPGLELINVWLVASAMALFSAAYLAENVRGGLQAIPRGQYEAADSLGLSNFDKYRMIILPQALRIVIPAIVGQFIGLFKDTSLVTLVGLFDLLDVANRISSQPDWLTIRTEPYIFLMFVYFIIASAMAWYSRRLERQLGVGQR